MENRCTRGPIMSHTNTAGTPYIGSILYMTVRVCAVFTAHTYTYTHVYVHTGRNTAWRTSAVGENGRYYFNRGGGSRSTAAVLHRVRSSCDVQRVRIALYRHRDGWEGSRNKTHPRDHVYLFAYTSSIREPPPPP